MVSNYAERIIFISLFNFTVICLFCWWGGLVDNLYAQRPFRDLLCSHGCILLVFQTRVQFTNFTSWYWNIEINEHTRALAICFSKRFYFDNFYVVFLYFCVSSMLSMCSDPYWQRMFANHLQSNHFILFKKLWRTDTLQPKKVEKNYGNILQIGGRLKSLPLRRWGS